jgi:hypothetical protein
MLLCGCRRPRAVLRDMADPATLPQLLQRTQEHFAAQAAPILACYAANERSVWAVAAASM